MGDFLVEWALLSPVTGIQFNLAMEEVLENATYPHFLDHSCPIPQWLELLV